MDKSYTHTNLFSKSIYLKQTFSNRLQVVQNELGAIRKALGEFLSIPINWHSTNRLEQLQNMPKVIRKIY